MGSRIGTVPQLRGAVRTIFTSHSVVPSRIPRLSLCVSRILALFSRYLSNDGHAPRSGLLAGAVIGGCIGRKLVAPIGNGGCAHRRVVRLLYICRLGRALHLGSIGTLANQSSMSFTTYCRQLLTSGGHVHRTVPPLLGTRLPRAPSSPRRQLYAYLTLDRVTGCLHQLYRDVVSSVPRRARKS